MGSPQDRNGSCVQQYLGSGSAFDDGWWLFWWRHGYSFNW
jgi:hypothetical protein